MKSKLVPVLAVAMIAGTLTATDAAAQWRGGGGARRIRGRGRGEGPGWGWRGRGWAPGVAAGVIGGAVIAGAILATRPPGYVVYPGYAEPLYGPDCYWASQPVLDRAGRVVGHTGRPVQVCPGYAGPPPPADIGPPPPAFVGPPPPAYDGPPPPAYDGPPPAARIGPPTPARPPAAARSVSRDSSRLARATYASPPHKARLARHPNRRRRACNASRFNLHPPQSLCRCQPAVRPRRRARRRNPGQGTRGVPLSSRSEKRSAPAASNAGPPSSAPPQGLE